jgi:hypothetical protein
LAQLPPRSMWPRQRCARGSPIHAFWSIIKSLARGQRAGQASVDCDLLRSTIARLCCGRLPRVCSPQVLLTAGLNRSGSKSYYSLSPTWQPNDFRPMRGVARVRPRRPTGEWTCLNDSRIGPAR